MRMIDSTGELQYEVQNVKRVPAKLSPDLIRCANRRVGIVSVKCM